MKIAEAMKRKRNFELEMARIEVLESKYYLELSKKVKIIIAGDAGDELLKALSSTFSIPINSNN